MYTKAWQGVMFRRTYPELEDLIKRSLEIYPASGAKWSEQKKVWVWPNGATLRMRYLEAERDATRYQGHQYTWIGWDELTQWATDYAYKYLRGRLRSAHNVPTKRIRAAANPGGVGHHWVKAYFVDPHPTGYEPLSDPDTGGSRMFVPAQLRDNRILLQADPGYANRLKGVGSAQLVRALLEGDWSVIEGAFFPEWSNAKHILAPFRIPEGWTRFRSMDWGSAKPFSVGWWAVVGEEFPLADGRILPRGALIRYREWYGASKPNVGLKMPAEEVGAGIVRLEQDDGEINYGVLDPAAFASDGGPSIAERLYSNGKGPLFRRADNARVSQRGAMGGWDQVRARLIGDGERPHMYVFSTCRDTIRTFPAMQHDSKRPEDVDTDGEDHAPDEIRYACASRPYARPIDVPLPIRGAAEMTIEEAWSMARPQQSNPYGRI